MRDQLLGYRRTDGRIGEKMAIAKSRESNSGAVLVDFEKDVVPSGDPGFLLFDEQGYEENGFVFSAMPASDGLIIATVEGLEMPGAVQAIAKLSALAVGSNPNQALAPNYPDADLVVNYQEIKGSSGMEREDFRFKGAYLSAFNGFYALDQFEVTFTAYLDGELVGEFATMATSGTFVRSGITRKMDTLVIGASVDSVDGVNFWIDNAVFKS